jgi:maltose O-acetyltransferase
MFARVLPKFWQLPAMVIRRLAMAMYRLRLGYCGEGVLIYQKCRLTFPQHISIGAKTSIAPHCALHAASKGKISIGERCAIAAFTRIITPTHDPDALPVAAVGINKSVVIGDDVWIGTGVIVLPGVSIGSRTIVAAGAVVNRDLPPDVLAAGVPARVVKKLLPHETRLEHGRRAQELKWRKQ